MQSSVKKSAAGRLRIFCFCYNFTLKLREIDFIMAHGSVLLHALFVNALFLLISENAGENICGEGGDCFVIAVDIAVQQLFGGADIFAEVKAVFLRHEIGAGICEVGKALAEEAQLVQLFVFSQLCDLIDFRFVVQFCDIQRISQRADTDAGAYLSGRFHDPLFDPSENA